MKSELLILILAVAFTAHATVVELNDRNSEQVLEVYEEMREEDLAAHSDNTWIHDFETDKLGKEMDHLQSIKQTALAREE